MKVICAWCGKTINRREKLKVKTTRVFSEMWKRIKGTADQQEEMVSYGICDDCKEKLLQTIDEE